MLNLDYNKIANWEEVCYIDHPESGERVVHPFSVAMGIMLMHTGFQTITHDNADDVYARAKLVETCVGAFYTNGDGTPHYLTPEDVHKYIGLASNVSVMSEATFYKHLRSSLTKSLRQTYTFYAKEQERIVKERIKATVEADPVLRTLT